MAGVTITHAKVTGAPAGTVPTRVYGADWDAVHVVSGLAASATTDTTNASNITSGTLSAAQLPTPTASTLGGVKSLAAASHQFLTAIGTDGGPTRAQPAFTDLSGSVAGSQMPALTGDVTTSAGSIATTLATVNSNVGTFGAVNSVPIVTVNGKGLVTAASSVAIREVLTAARTYYVRADGSDSNNGLANTSGGAFLTIQKAIDVACGLDLSIYSVTIQVGAGTYTGANTLKSYIGAGPITITGDTTTPSNCLISTTSSSCVTADGVEGAWKMGGFKFATTTTGHALNVINGSVLTLNGACDFGAVASGADHINIGNAARVYITANYTISGAASAHVLNSQGGIFDNNSVTVTLSGSPVLSYFYRGVRLATISSYSVTYSGSPAAGTQKYNLVMNSILETAGATASVPGSVAGATATGSQAE